MISFDTPYRQRTMTPQFADNSSYVEYERLLIELHEYMSSGNEDEADRVRDAMDAPERNLSSVEIQRLNGLSGDLYMLTDNEKFEPHSESQEQVMSGLASAWLREDLEETLRLLRRGPIDLSKDRIASMRARAYERLGHEYPARLFQRYAARLRPSTQDNGDLPSRLLPTPEAAHAH
jgi:hypothetical protein